jgi:sensor c-di-GMP phosphodiesterase-like protein
MVGLAGALEIGVAAEGVESVDQQSALTAIGVSSLQGWLYAKAMTRTALLKRLKSVPLPA